MDENMTEQVRESNVIELWAQKYSDVTRWLAKLQVKDRSAYSLYRFCQWSKKSPPELLELKRRDPSANLVEKLLDDYVAEAKAKGVKSSIQFHVSIAVRSFFRHNYVDLAKAAGAVVLEKVKPYNKLTKEGLRKLWTWALNPRDKALVTFVNSTAIAKETLTKLKWSHLEQNWENIDLPCVNIEPELLKGHGQGKYRGVRQVTFLTPEAKRDLLNYKEWIEQKLGRKLTAEDNIWLEVYTKYKPLRYRGFSGLIYELSRNTGVKFSWHDARRWVTTALEQTGISPNWAKVIRGRKPGGAEAPYSQPAIEQLRAKFREAVPILEFTSSEVPAVPKEVLDRIEKLETERAEIRRQYHFRTGDELKEDKKRIAKEAEKTKDCPDGAHCAEFSQIPEAQLLAHLKDGWEIIKELSNGEVIVKRVR